jgi:hypothetical protein
MNSQEFSGYFVSCGWTNPRRSHVILWDYLSNQNCTPYHTGSVKALMYVSVLPGQLRAVYVLRLVAYTALLIELLLFIVAGESVERSRRI